MRSLFLLALMAPIAFGADWESLRAITADTKIEVVTKAGEHARASFASASADALVAREKKGERSFAKTEVVEVKVYDSSRRMRQGLIWTAVGAGIGAGIGFAVCPSCSNEGHGGKYVGPGVGIGAAIGALGFLAAPYRTVYKVH